MKPVVVVGTCFVDIKCFPDARLDYKGRNPGRVVFQHGGVGRNVAETLARLGVGVRFLSSVTAGGLGDEVTGRLSGLGVEVGAVARLPEAGHGLWVAILEADGDLACSISQVFDYSGMKATWRQQHRRLLDGAALVVLEVDLDEEMAAMVLDGAAAARVPVFGLPSNFSVTREHPGLLRRMHTFICNQHEAELLLGQPVTAESAPSAARELARRLGPERVVTTLGPAGAVAVHGVTSGMAESVRQPAIPTAAVDTTGAGDAFVAGFAAAAAAGMSTGAAMACAVRVAAWTVNSSEPVCQDLPDRTRADDWPGWREMSRR